MGDLAPDYREILKGEYQKRLEKNPGYSLRSFSRDLKVSPSMLSEVFNFKKTMTRKTAQRIALSLGLSRPKTELFLLSVDLENPGFHESRELIQQKIEKSIRMKKDRSLTDEEFAMISDHRHLVFLAMIKLSGFKNQLSWIAKALGVFQYQARTILNHLTRLKVIHIDSKNQIQVNDGYLRTTEGDQSIAVREFHKNVLRKTVSAVDALPAKERDLYTSIFAFQADDFEAVQKDIRDFHAMIYEKYSKKPDANRVYSVQTQFVPQTSRIKDVK